MARCYESNEESYQPGKNDKIITNLSITYYAELVCSGGYKDFKVE